jgi:hypothetical protein
LALKSLALVLAAAFSVARVRMICACFIAVVIAVRIASACAAVGIPFASNTAGAAVPDRQGL